MSDQNPSYSLNFQQEMSTNHPSSAAHHHSSAALPPRRTSKRVRLNRAPPPWAAGDGGYTTLLLPVSFAVASRSYSHPARTSSGTILNPPPQGTSNAVQGTASDPSPFKNLGTPPLARTSSGSLSCGESPSVKRLRRMKELAKEITEWCNQLLSDGVDDTQFQNNNSDHIPKEESETETENPSQEAVWVERNGDSHVLHFRCPCGRRL